MRSHFCIFHIHQRWNWFKLKITYRENDAKKHFGILLLIIQFIARLKIIDVERKIISENIFVIYVSYYTHFLIYFVRLMRYFLFWTLEIINCGFQHRIWLRLQFRLSNRNNITLNTHPQLFHVTFHSNLY